MRLSDCAGTPWVWWFSVYCRSWAEFLDPVLACKRLAPALPLCTTALLAHKTPCHHWLLAKKLSGQESCELFKTPPHSQDCVGKLGLRIGHLPVDKRGPGSSGTLLFCASQPGSGKAFDGFPQLGFNDVEGSVPLIGAQGRQPNGSGGQVSQLQS